MRHELIAAALLFAVTACEKKATTTPGGVSVSGSAGGANASATVPTSTPTTPTTPTTPPTTPPAGGGGGTTTPPPAAGKPTVVRGDAEIKGELDKEKLHTALAAIEPAMLACYNSALERTPGFTGKVAVRFIVGGKGKILSADLAERLADNVLADCVLKAAKDAKLPKPSNGKDVILTQPFSLELQ